MKPGESQLVEALFDSVAQRYDLLNDLLSLGLHRLWKKQLLTLLSPSPGQQWLDLCCGTGDLTFELARCVQPGGMVFGVDSAEQPLEVARKRAEKKSLLALHWLKRDVLDSGLTSHQFDGAVMGYGLRNLSDPLKGLKEMHRLLKPGSKAGVLDFNQMDEGSFGERFQKLYLRKLVVPIASIFGLGEHYAYLEKSIKCFPFGKEQEEIAFKAGFKEACHIPIAAKQMGVLLLTA